MENAVYFGINPPFLGGNQNVLSVQTDERLIKNDVLQLLMTVPGERVYRPNFGVGVRAIVFDTMSDAELATLTSSIRQQLAEDERIVTNDVLVTLAEDGSQLNVRVEVSPIWARLSNYLIEVGITQTGQVLMSNIPKADQLTGPSPELKPQ